MSIILLWRIKFNKTPVKTYHFSGGNKTSAVPAAWFFTSNHHHLPHPVKPRFIAIYISKCSDECCMYVLVILMSAVSRIRIPHASWAPKTIFRLTCYQLAYPAFLINYQTPGHWQVIHGELWKFLLLNTFPSLLPSPYAAPHRIHLRGDCANFSTSRVFVHFDSHILHST